MHQVKLTRTSGIITHIMSECGVVLNHICDMLIDFLTYQLQLVR